MDDATTVPAHPFAVCGYLDIGDLSRPFLRWAPCSISGSGKTFCEALVGVSSVFLLASAMDSC